MGSAGRLTPEHLALHSLRGVTDERKRNAARRIVESPKQGNNWRPRLTIRRGEILAGKPTMRALLLLAGGAAVGRCAADEPPREEWRGRLEMTVTFHDRRTGEIHSLDLSRGQRRDQYDASVDGTPWKRGISATQLARFFRMKLKPHICRA